MPLPRRICLRDVALAAGCHYSTVSLALRNHPRLPVATRERVQGIARKLGYVPDPMLASLAHYRKGLRPVEYHATLAWVTNHAERSGWREAPIFADYFKGAADRAAQLGYRLEEFWLREPGMTPARAERILQARSITGLLLSPQPRPGTTIEFDWSAFSAVAIGFSLVKPNLHVVCPHQFRAIKHALQQLLGRGYRRPGLVMLRASDDRVDQNWQAGYLVTQQGLPVGDRLPPLFLPEWDEAAFIHWYERHRPDVLLTKFNELIPTLRRLKRAIPRQVGVAILTHAEPGGNLAGIYENPHAVGAAAVDYLTGMLYRNERGIPAFPQRILIDGSWIEGRTVRRPTVVRQKP